MQEHYISSHVVHTHILITNNLRIHKDPTHKGRLKNILFEAYYQVFCSPILTWILKQWQIALAYKIQEVSRSEMATG